MNDRWSPVPFAGGSYADETMPWTRQDTVNYLPTRAERSGARSDMILKQCPGMRIVCDLGHGPIRATYNVEGRLLAVSGDKLFKLDTNFNATEIGTLPGVGRVSVAHNQVANGNQVLFATGNSGYIYNTADGSFAAIADTGYPGAMCVRFIGQYFAQIEPQRRYWFISDLADGFSYNTLDTYEAEAQPDKLYSLESNAGRLFAFGERTIECYDNIVTENAAFQRSGIVIDRGVASGFATCVLDNAILFLGNDGVVYRMDGYNPVRISHHPLETALAASDLRRTFFTTWEDRGHKVAYLTLQDGNTWGYDVASQEWHRRQSYGLNRWRANTLTQWNEQWIAGDYANGKLYRLEWDHGYEGYDSLVRERTFAVLHNDFNPVRVNAVRLLVDSGAQESAEQGSYKTTPLVIAGNVPDGYVGESIAGRYVISGGSPPYGNVSKASGTFPPGLTLQSTGAYSGVFTTAGSYSWDTQATDSAGQTATVADTCTVVAPLWRDADKGASLNTYDVAINPDGDFLTAGHSGDIRFTSDKGASFSVVTPFTVSPYICAENFDGYWFVANEHSESDNKWRIHAAVDNGTTPSFAGSFNTGSAIDLRLRARNGKLFALESSPDGSFGPSFRVRTDNATWPRTTVSGISEALGSAFVDVWYIEDRYVFLLANGVILHSPDLISFGYAGTFSGNPTGGNWFANGRLLVRTVAGWEYSDDKGVTTHPFASAQGTTGIVFAFNKWWSGSNLYIYSSANGNDPWTLEHSNTHAPDGVAGWIWSNGTNLIIQGGNRYLNVYYVP